GVWRFTAAQLAGLTFTAPPDFNTPERGVATLTFTARAAAAVSTAASTPVVVRITVASVNDAPTLAAGRSVRIPSGPLGMQVSAIVGGVHRDVDAAPRFSGMAITKLNGTGAWQYLRRNSGVWRTIRGASADRPFLLPFFARLRFVPAAGAGRAGASVRFRAWDQTIGTAYTRHRLRSGEVGGTGAFSTTATTARLQRSTDARPVTNAASTTGATGRSAKPTLSAALLDAVWTELAAD
ncbi:MAG: hypothetical protein ACRC1K_18450, partial [Planctomycetia bacterium]